MKIKIWEKEQEVEEQPLRLRLMQEGGLVTLTAVNTKGVRVSRGSLLSIDNKGVLHLYASTSTHLGLQLDDCECIKIGSSL